ncbi:hypothetical protein CLV58_11179 [Spirosoma oryzae]|uniref:Uncharacterized protein n=1 Tax=Spirosoma oryzae TaxID=1469603 RepID=A0A2T0SUE8_9BACT|nr:hypothetical protein [Spirosoma oryzae]PRY37041.1 hypothetical protein CLV58_11179 [Spirosoma oryzae]
MPYFFIANLYPFNNTSEKVFYNEHDVYSLSIKNKELVEFLENSVELKDGYIDFKKDYLSKISNEDELKKNKDSLIYVTDVLNYSAINTIKFEDFRNFPKKVLLYNTTKRDCECFTCLIGQLKLDKLIDKLLITDITDASDLQEDARLAYSHYKCGNIYQSYNLFEEIAQKAWHTGKYVVYFICKFNLKRLGHIIHWKEYKNLSSDLIQEISSKAEKIDLDAVYRHTNEISKEEAQLMKIIRDDEILDKASGYVADEYEKIKQIRKSLDNGSSTTTASRSEHVIDFHLITVDMFYNRNFIVNDVFSEYIDMYNTGVKALLLNYANYRDYSQEQISLDYEFCFYFIYYGKYSELKNTIAEYKIKDLHLDVESEEKVYDIIVNYYKSFIGNSGTFGRHEVNHKIYNQINKSSFDYKFVDIFDNISLLLGIIDFGKDKFKIISENLLNALKYTDIFHPSNVINLEYVFIGNTGYIDSEFGQNLLEILCDKPKLFTKEILDYVVHAFIDKDDSKKINNLDLINAVIETLESRSREVHSKTVSYLERIYKIVSSEHKQVIVDKAMDRLGKEFSNREYWDYVMNGIIKYDTFFDKYLENILSNSYQIHSYEFDYLFVGKKRTKPDMHFEFINFIRLLYKFDLLEKYNDVKDSFVDLRDYMIFYLNPERFDCENFKVEWLFCTYEPSVHRALSKISFVKSAFDSFIKEKKGAEYLELYTEYYL